MGGVGGVYQDTCTFGTLARKYLLKISKNPIRAVIRRHLADCYPFPFQSFIPIVTDIKLLP